MRTLRYEKMKQAVIAEVAPPEISPSQALGRTIVSNVSAGTEMAFYRGTAPQLNSRMLPNGLWEEAADNLTYPMSASDPGCWWMGYACVSEIVEVGAELAGKLKIGDIVFTPQGHKELQVVDENAIRVPDGMRPESASFKTLTEIAYNGFLDAKIKLMDDVVIFGMGTIGQLLVRMCALAGARVAAVDFIDERLAIASAGGAEYTINPSKTGVSAAESVLEAFGGKADAVIEVSGNSKALNEAVRCVKKDGQVTVLSFYQEPPVNFLMGREFHHNRVVVRSSQIGGISPEISHLMTKDTRAEKAMELLTKMDVAPLISHRCAFEEYPEVIREISENPSKTLSVVIEYR